ASGSAEVAAFCTSADTLAAKLKAGMSDPSKLADLTKEATDFVTKAAALSGTNPSDSAAIQACAMKVTKAVTPG
ncbi:MAG: hypothetical protein JWM12_900, partial [Ilumatobacteraceae bacterium]|nr:hypothetical protein [Ilumatobacteraceae bacterium]